MIYKLKDIAKVIRSKNAGPYELTLDILFKDSALYDTIKTQKAIKKTMIAELYAVPEEDIHSIIYFDPAAAVKVTMKRRIASGGLGDTDIYGAQQHAPLIDMELEIDV